MAQPNPSKNRNISEVVLNVTLNNLANFKEFKTDEFFVNGTPWFMRFSKEKDGKKEHLTVHLHSNLEYNSTDAFIVATCDVMLLSPKVNGKPHEANICLDAYCADNKVWGLCSFIEWNRLKNGFIADDKCKFKLMVKATELMTAAKDYWLKQGLKFERMVEHEDGSDRKFRLTINEFHNSIGVCSPKIKFNESFWRIVVIKKEGSMWVLICQTSGNTRLLTSKIKLMSSDPKVQTITNEGKEDTNFEAAGCYGEWELITWDDLIDPRKKFIQNDTSFVIEVEFKAGRGKPASKKRRAGAEDSGPIFSSCPICFEDLNGQPITSVKPCSHMFCRTCATSALKKKKKCPTCNGDVSSVQSYIATE